jgi:hypothetical protein
MIYKLVSFLLNKFPPDIDWEKYPTAVLYTIDKNGINSLWSGLEVKPCKHDPLYLRYNELKIINAWLYSGSTTKYITTTNPDKMHNLFRRLFWKYSYMRPKDV